MNVRKPLGGSLFLVGGALFPLSQTSLFAPYAAVLWLLGIAVVVTAGVLVGRRSHARPAAPSQ